MQNMQPDWVPANPLGVEVPLIYDLKWPEVDWSMGGIIKKSPMSVSDPV